MCQNKCLTARRRSSFIGVELTPWNGFRTKFAVQGQRRKVSKTFREIEPAIELYDLAMLFQYGSQALVNHPEKQGEYLKKLKKLKTVQMINVILASKEMSSRFQVIKIGSARH